MSDGINAMGLMSRANEAALRDPGDKQHMASTEKGINLRRRWNIAHGGVPSREQEKSPRLIRGVRRGLTVPAGPHVCGCQSRGRPEH